MGKTVNLNLAISGIMLAGAAFAGNEALKMIGCGYSYAQVMAAAGISVAGGIVLDRFLNDNEYEKLWKMCGIVNKDGQIPLIIKEEMNNNKTTLVLHLPPGLSQKHFESKQEEIEQNLNAKIEFGFNKNLIIDVYKMNLKNRYSYAFEECQKPLEIYIGESVKGKFILDIAECPHMLIAGESGSGKSSFIDTICTSLILNKYNVDLHLIDFQSVTLEKYKFCKKVKSFGELPEDLNNLLDELEEENKRRRKLFTESKVYIDKISKWNEVYPDKALPYKVVVIDEFARLADKQYEDIFVKFKQRIAMDRKVGFHFLSSMQRPDTKIIEGSIKANMPTRAAFKVTSPVDSEVILGDIRGAEKLKNQGCCLIKHNGVISEVQIAYMEPDEIMKLLKRTGKLKTREDIYKERKELMEKFRSQNINPYTQGSNVP